MPNVHTIDRFANVLLLVYNSFDGLPTFPATLGLFTTFYPPAIVQKLDTVEETNSSSRAPPHYVFIEYIHDQNPSFRLALTQ